MFKRYFQTGEDEEVMPTEEESEPSEEPVDPAQLWDKVRLVTRLRCHMRPLWDCVMCSTAVQVCGVSMQRCMLYAYCPLATVWSQVVATSCCLSALHNTASGAAVSHHASVGGRLRCFNRLTSSPSPAVPPSLPSPLTPPPLLPQVLQVLTEGVAAIPQLSDLLHTVCLCLEMEMPAGDMPADGEEPVPVEQFRPHIRHALLHLEQLKEVLGLTPQPVVLQHTKQPQVGGAARAGAQLLVK